MLYCHTNLLVESQLKSLHLMLLKTVTKTATKVVIYCIGSFESFEDFLKVTDCCIPSVTV